MLTREREHCAERRLRGMMAEHMEHRAGGGADWAAGHGERPGADVREHAATRAVVRSALVGARNLHLRERELAFGIAVRSPDASRLRARSRRRILCEPERRDTRNEKHSRASSEGM